MRRVVPEERQRSGGGVTEQPRGCGVGCRYKCARGMQQQSGTTGGTVVETPLGDEGRDEGDPPPRNQDDNRRVGAVMHDAQIRAIIPITVQIIVRELVAAKRVASAETQPKTPCSTPNRNDTGSSRYRAGGERGRRLGPSEFRP